MLKFGKQQARCRSSARVIAVTVDERDHDAGNEIIDAFDRAKSGQCSAFPLSGAGQLALRARASVRSTRRTVFIEVLDGDTRPLIWGNRTAPHRSRPCAGTLRDRRRGKFINAQVIVQEQRSRSAVLSRKILERSLVARVNSCTRWASSPLTVVELPR